ncbi:hypothetical protein ACIQBJ_31650 [Kitasatospora sp. NPDC088391]|uniref:hypothetical protein n=1 Tax=Kitasatospora sp. NPDC088391 TaxID=3364074 RepID=UPI003830D674
MDFVDVLGQVAVALLAGSSVVRVWVREGPRPGDVFSGFLWSAAAVALGWGDGPLWLSVLGWTGAGLTVLALLVPVIGAAVSRPLVEVDPVEFRARLLALGDGAGPPDAVLLGVGPDGTVTVWGLEAHGVPRHRHRPGPGCATCFLEGVVAELADNGPEVVEEYRVLLRHRANQLFLLERGVISGRWTAGLRPVRGLRAPFEHSPCSVHRL